MTGVVTKAVALIAQRFLGNVTKLWYELHVVFFLC